MFKKVKISVFFIAFFVLMVAAGMGTEAICLIIALAIHELGHIIAAKIQGCKIEKLSIQPLGGYLYLDQVIETEPSTELRVALAGPVANLITAAITMAVVTYPGHYIASYFIRANLVLMAFNLFPALPLDGGRVLRARLAGWIPYWQATRVVVYLGFICGLILLVFGLIVLFSGSPNPTIFAAGLFLLYNAYIEKKQLLIPMIRYVLGRQKKLAQRKFITADVLVALPGTRVNEILKHIRPQRYYQISVLNDKFKIDGTLTEHQLLKQITTGTGQRLLSDIVQEEREEKD